jgi:AAA domain, putative AbiEii toxin, Type IV TA system
MLKELHLKYVGPAERFDVQFADRLNIFTGDNGLGKSFLLDVAWWVLTRTWIDQPAYPNEVETKTPEIIFLEDSKERKYFFDFSEQRWRTKMLSLQKTDELVIYIRADGSFAAFDPARKKPQTFNFTTDKLWNGLKSGSKVLCNGLLQDWVSWQRQPDPSLFQKLSEVLKTLSPHPNEWMEPGEPTRISLDDVRDIPTINLPYGNLPITQASAGMKRILGLAYLLVWLWNEHLITSNLRHRPPTHQIILLIDEVESHLHPQWQRTILPTLLTVITDLWKQEQVTVQAIATTHAPLVLASVEPLFDAKQDKLFLFDLENQIVRLEELEWAKQGDADNWLTSPIFDLKRPRSREAEIAIDAAFALMRSDNMEVFPEHLRTQTAIHQELLRVLPDHDKFWHRWVVTAEEPLHAAG